MPTNDSFTEVTRQSWLSRIKGALGGLLVGVLLLIGAPCLLWWNEGRAIRTATALYDGQKEFIAVSADSVNEANDGKIVYLTGLASTEEILQDPEFEVEQNALMLRRHSEMYQWVEKKESSSNKNLGGSETTTTNYSYSKEWSPKLIDSSDFKKSQEHVNPDEFNYPGESWIAGDATLGAFHLSEELVEKIGDEVKVAIEAVEGDEETIVSNGAYYVGNDPKRPEIGDMRVSYYAIYPKKISVVAGQTAGSLASFTSSNGTSIALVKPGEHSAESLFAAAQSENSMLTWLVRLGGLLMAIVGFAMIMTPLSVLADVIPILGSIVAFGTGLLAALLGTSLAAITIAIAWFAYRPLLAGFILFAVGALAMFIVRRKRAPLAA